MSHIGRKLYFWNAYEVGIHGHNTDDGFRVDNEDRNFIVKEKETLILLKS